jgi:hypothetical protein
MTRTAGRRSASDDQPTDKIDMTVGMRHHDQDDLATPESVVPGVTAARAPNPNSRFVGNVFEGSGRPGVDAVELRQGHVPVLVQDQFTKAVMGYIGYSEGFNSGGASVYTDPSTASE